MLFEVIARHGRSVIDIEQIEIHGRLLLAVAVSAPGGAGGDAPTDAQLVEELTMAAGSLGLTVDWEELVGAPEASNGARHHVTVLAARLPAATMAAVSGAVAECGATMTRIVRLAAKPVVAFELEVTGGQGDDLRRALAGVAARCEIDVAVQRAGLYRRAKRLVVLDVDSTLIQDEVIDLLAEEAGCAAEVAAVTESAMAGEMDFEASLRARVRLLAGLGEEQLHAVGRRVRLTPGAGTLVRTLRLLGCEVALVSGGFSAVIDGLAATLGITLTASNELEVVGGKLTGEVAGPVVDRAGKAAALVRFAEMTGVPLNQTVAVGDGANDIDMIATAGLGVAFNAKPVVRAAADATVSVPYLDAILFLLGISLKEIEAAEHEPSLP